MGLQPESRDERPVKFKEGITLAVIGTRPISKKRGAWVLDCGVGAAPFLELHRPFTG